MKFYLSILTTILLFSLSVFSQTKASDRDVEGFKGNVWKVSEKETDFIAKKGEYVETLKVISDEMEFAENGEFIQRNLYSDGEIFIERKFGYLDNERIIIDKTSQKEIIFTVVSPNKHQDNEKKDNRFSFKFKYKYDEKGRRIEEEWYNNLGKLWIRDVRKYDDNGNEIKWFRYSSDGKINIESISEFDAKGNEVKKSYLLEGLEDEVYIYDYKFDTQGNWIERNTKKVKVKNGKSELVPYQVNYRKITYFNQK